MPALGAALTLSALAGCGTPTRGHQDPVPGAQVEDSTGGNEALAKKLQNPIADLISVPVQNNWDFEAGPGNDGEIYKLNIQPVIPFPLGDEWNLVTRTIVPVIAQRDVIPGDDRQSGLGDIVASQFFSPRTGPGELIWGVGPVWLLPTATDDPLGAGKWGMGPTGVVLKQDGPWTYGGLANHIWSFAGDEDRREVNATFLQPFASYTFPTATSLGVNTEATYDWTSENWTVPINVFASQIVRIGKLPVSILVGARHFAEGPDGSPEWGLRLQFTLLLPR